MVRVVIGTAYRRMVIVYSEGGLNYPVVILYKESSVKVVALFRFLNIINCSNVIENDSTLGCTSLDPTTANDPNDNNRYLMIL